jgi:quinohemoprotein ethanol dehydrogenase
MTRRRIAVALVFGILAFGVLSLYTSVPTQSADDLPSQTAANWPLPGGNKANTRHSTLSQITTRNIESLGAAWVTDLGDTTSRATPVVADGLMFLPVSSSVWALDARSGEVIWRYDTGSDRPSNRGLALGDGFVFAATSSGKIIAVTQATGDLVWTYTPPEQQTISVPPTYARGLVVAAIAEGDNFKRGRIVAVNAKNGQEVWRFNAIPGPGEFGHETWPQDCVIWKHGGGGVWMVPTVDDELGLVYVGTGNAVPPWGGELRAGDNLFSVSVLALDLKTGQRKWHYQLVRHDIWDADLSTPVIMYDATIDGKTVKALAVMRTDGVLFLFDRESGRPLIPIEERPVPQDAALKTAPTQPFPRGAERIGPDCVEKELLPPGFVLGCYYEPIGKDVPNYTTMGLAMRFAPMAYSPRTGYFYATACVYPLWVRRDASGWLGTSGGTLSRVPTGKSYGLITAVDGRNAQVVWKKRMPYPLCGGSGAMTTDGGLMFHWEPDGNLQAYDAERGDRLWQFQTGIASQLWTVGPNGAPTATYEAGGEQYVAVVTAPSVWAFKLGGKLPQRPAPSPPSTEESFRGPLEDTNQIVLSTSFGQNNAAGARRWTYDYGLTPTRSQVYAGTAVTWTNTGSLAHTIEARDGSWSTNTIGPGESGSVTVHKAGTYVYTCKEHPFTLGELVVK